VPFRNDTLSRLTSLENGSGSGTVTSVGLTVPTGLSVSGSPITGAGTIAISFAPGYSIPTTAKQAQWDAMQEQQHTHANKALLDQITQSNIDVLSKLSIVDGNIKVDATLWATGGISALGLGEGGSGGGGGADMLQSWETYTSDKANYYVPASLLVPFRNDTLSRLTSIENGSATSIETTGSGNAITSVSKSGNTLIFAKGSTFSLSTHNHDTVYKPIGYVPSWSEITGKPSTFAPSAHTHTIANITGLQGALDLKATQSDIDTAINNLEIGGRNLVKDSGVEITGTGALRFYTLSEPLIYGETYTATFKAKKGEGAGFKLWLNNNITGSGLNLDNNDPNEIIIKSHTFTFTGSETNANRVSIYSEFSSNPSTIYWLKLEKGNKATDWTPAPEDQVSDWNTTDVTSFSYIKNKPTQLSQFTDNIGVANHIANTSNPHNVTKAQVGLGNVDNTADSAKNVLSATKLTTARTIAGVSFDGTANIAIPFANLSSKPTTLAGYGITDAVTLNTAQTITGAKTFSTLLTASAGINTPKVIFAAAGWSLEQVGMELQMKHNGVIKQRMLSDGTILATGGVTALATS
jgi:hypothetical protein